MKTNICKTFFMMFLLSVYVFDASSQGNLSQILASIKEKVQDVQVDKMTYKQSIDILDESKGKLSFVSEQVDEKGKTTKESFEFYVSDIDKNTIVRKTSGKKLFLSMTVINNQKFVKYFRDDKQEAYTNSLEILSSGADAATELTDLFKSAIPLVTAGTKIWQTNTDALDWIKNNLSKISTGQATFEQSFSYGNRKDYIASYTLLKTDQKSVTTEERYEFNILDINLKNLVVKVSGSQLSVSVETRGNDPYIKYSRNNEPQNYDNKFEIVAQDIEQARNIIAAFTTAIEKSKQVMPDFTSLQKSLDYLSEKTTDLTQDKKTVTQKIEFTPGNGTKAIFISGAPDSKGKQIVERYEFYLGDMDANNLNFKVSGKKIAIMPVTLNKTKFIKYYKDNILQDFQNQVEILTADLETTREMVDAFKSAIKNSSAPPVSWKNINEAVAFLAGITGETLGTDNYSLGFSSVSTDPLSIRYVIGKTDAKGAKVEQSFEFYPYMLDPASVKAGSSGKYLGVEVTVSGKKSYIKVIKDGRQQPFTEVVEFMAFDARQAREITDAIKYLAGNSKPKELSWPDNQSSMNYILGHVSDMKNEGTEIKQKIELTDNDPCKVSFKVSTTDDKGKTTDEIFEFNLGDINKQMVELKVSGKNIEVILPCKNKEKLVKVYKNSEQQAWGASVSIGATDVETAKNVAEAFKSTVARCGK